MSGMAEVVVDGRVLRGERNRQAIVDALLSLYDEGVLRPSANEVAERAGVSVRSVHNHFADMESLRAEVASRQWGRIAPPTEPISPDLPLPRRIREVVDRRSALYEAITPVRRAAMLSVHESPTIARRLTSVGRVLRKQLEGVFAPELARGDASLLDAIDLAVSWDAWERLRTQQRLGIAAAKRVLVLTLNALLTKGNGK